MEELKSLIQMINGLPNAAIWVLGGYLFFKLAIIGSVYQVIALFITKAHDYLVTKKAREVEYKEIRPMLDGMCIKAATEALVSQIHRLRGKGTGISSDYIHAQGVEWLRQAIDDKMDKDRREAAEKEAKKRGTSTTE